MITMLQYVNPQRVGTKKQSRENALNHLQREILEIFVSGVWVGVDKNISDQFGGEWRRRLLKGTTGKGGHFRTRKKTCARQSTRMTTAKTLSSNGYLA